MSIEAIGKNLKLGNEIESSCRIARILPAVILYSKAGIKPREKCAELLDLAVSLLAAWVGVRAKG